MHGDVHVRDVGMPMAVVVSPIQYEPEHGRYEQAQRKLHLDKDDHKSFMDPKNVVLSFGDDLYQIQKRKDEPYDNIVPHRVKSKRSLLSLAKVDHQRT